MSALRVSIVVLLLAIGNHAAAADGLEGRLIVGYQGWFGCPGDFEGNKGWQHWFDGAASAKSLTVDLLPSVNAFEAKDLCDTGLKRNDGSPVYVFSSQNAKVVGQHLQWMKQHGIDGLAFQRFVSHLRHPGLLKRSDNVLGHVRKGAERTGRAFYVSYDVSGADAATVLADIRADWKYIDSSSKLTRSPAYWRHNGKPVVQLWGFGFRDRPGGAEDVARLIAELKAGSAGSPAATVIGGVPVGWRTLTADSQRDSGWAAAYRAYDVISPWAVGRFSDDAGADRFRRQHVEPDLIETRKFGIGYLPVVFPGFSWRNLMSVRGQAGKAILNQIPRRCGRFLQHQVSNLLASGATSLYAAMFDEVDEATALFPLETRKDAGPSGAALLALDTDGCVLPDDWYLGLTGKAAQSLRSRPLPASVPAPAR